MTNFLQKVFNTISLQKDEKLWLSTDDNLTENRFQLLAKFQETQFAPQLKLDCVANAKNGKLSSALREKGNLCYAQGDCESALRLYNQVRNPHLGGRSFAFRLSLFTFVHIYGTSHIYGTFVHIWDFFLFSYDIPIRGKNEPS